MRALFEAGADVNKAADDGETPLYVAAEVGHDAIVQVLIQAGADINMATDDGSTPLSISMAPTANIAERDHAAIVQILRDAGAV